MIERPPVSWGYITARADAYLPLVLYFVYEDRPRCLIDVRYPRRESFATSTIISYNSRVKYT
jgi:hypothetical protein